MGFPFGTRGAGYGLDAELARKQAAKYDPQQEREVQQWIESVTGERFTQPFADHLKSGVTLVKLINKIQPGSVARVETSSMPFKQMENISNFLRACRKLGMAEHDCFETVDLFEQKDMGVVVNCLQALRRRAASGPSHATQKPRQFTNQLGANGAVPILNNGSAGIMDRAPVSRSNDITFGRDAGGRGRGADSSVPILNKGSAGIMDRAPVSRSNDITFGRDAGNGKYTTGGTGRAPTKFCTGCGEKLSPAGKFCQGCGTKK